MLMPADPRQWLPDGHLACRLLDLAARMDLSGFGSACRTSPCSWSITRVTARSAHAAGPEPAGPSQWLYWCPSTITLTLRGLAVGRQPR
jgi:hypothetical protein